MNALIELRKQMEIDFLKTKTYEEINDMFNQINDKLKLAESEVKKFCLGAVSGRSELLLAFVEYIKKDNELTETVNENDVDAFLKSQQ
jgi:hypothetical protein